jgi:hypothetical protein
MGTFFRFIAEGPGAQLFMFLMGINMALKPQPGKLVIQRALIFLLTGYILNMFKFVIPLMAGYMPPAMMEDLNLRATGSPILYLLSIGDILHFAAIAIVVLWPLTKLKKAHIFAGYLAIAICIVSPLCWDITCRAPLINYTLQLVTGQPPQTFFPIFPWLVYPLAGIAVGHYRAIREEKIFEDFKIAGILLVLISALIESIFSIPETSFYRTGPSETVRHLAIVFFTLYIWDWLAANVSPNRFFDFITYHSKHITQIYILQWLIIAALLPFIPYKGLSLNQSIVLILFTAGGTVLISKMMNSLFKS